MTIGDDLVTFIERQETDAAEVAESVLRELDVDVATEWRTVELSELPGTRV